MLYILRMCLGFILSSYKRKDERKREREWREFAGQATAKFVYKPTGGFRNIKLTLKNFYKSEMLDEKHFEEEKDKETHLK